MVVDFHTHAFPDQIARRAIETVEWAGGGLTANSDGTLAGLRASLCRDGGADARAVLLPIATKPSQQRRVNDWAASIGAREIIAFGSVHPDAPDVLDELVRVKALGLKGVKLHPEYQGFFVDEARMKPIYRKIAALDLIVVFHAGMDLGYMPPPHCTPERLLRALDDLNGSRVVAAHMGGYMLWERALDLLCGRELYLDTAYCHSRILRPLMRAMIEKHGARRVLFGSDFPWSAIEQEARLVRSLDLSEAETERIFFRNAMELLGLE